MQISYLKPNTEAYYDKVRSWVKKEALNFLKNGHSTRIWLPLNPLRKATSTKVCYQAHSPS